MNKKSTIFRSAIAFIFCVVTIVMYWIVSFTACFNDHTRIITVTDKERVNTSSYSKYLIMGEDENGELSLVVPEKNIPSGAEIC